jgi:outer membrane lipoprotein
MLHRRRFALAVLGLMVSLGAFGCQYPISREYRLQAREDLTAPMVQADPEAYKGDIVIWGGKILATANHADMTEITVLAAPLDSGEEPLSDAYSDGRFIARTGEFLDPEVFGRGKKVTLAGQITGTEERPLGETKYSYPVVEIKQIYVWAKEGYYDERYYYPGYYGAYGWPYYWGGPWYGYGGGFIGRPFIGRGEEREGREGGEEHEGGHERGR